MDIQKLKSQVIENIKNDIKSGDLTLRYIFIKHLSDIETLKENGLSYTRLYKSCEFKNITLNHFQKLLLHAKKNVSTDKTKSLPVTEKKEITNNSLIEWKLVIPDITERLISDLITSGIGLNEVKNLLKSSQISNSRELRFYLNEKKFKNNIV